MIKTAKGKVAPGPESNAMKNYRGTLRWSPGIPYPLVLHKRLWSVSCSVHFISAETAPGAHYIRGWMGLKNRCGHGDEEKNFYLAGIRNTVVQPVASHFMDWVISADDDDDDNNDNSKATIPGKHSTDSVQKAAVLGTSHIKRKWYSLKIEAWVVGCTIGSREQVPEEGKPVIKRWWWWWWW
jgi:hypothetical protein